MDFLRRRGQFHRILHPSRCARSHHSLRIQLYAGSQNALPHWLADPRTLAGNFQLGFRNVGWRKHWQRRRDSLRRNALAKSPVQREHPAATSRSRLLQIHRRIIPQKKCKGQARTCPFFCAERKNYLDCARGLNFTRTADTPEETEAGRFKKVVPAETCRAKRNRHFPFKSKTCICKKPDSGA